MELEAYNADLPSTMRVPNIAAARQQTHYYRQKVTKEECEMLLRGKPIGTFIARNSSTFPGGYCIMMRLLENGYKVTRSYLLEAVPGGIHLRLTEERVFPTLYNFIESHCQDNLLLPSRLVLPTEDWLAKLDPALSTKILLAGTPLPPRRHPVQTFSSGSQENTDSPQQSEDQRGNAVAAPCRPPKPGSPRPVPPARPPKEPTAAPSQRRKKTSPDLPGSNSSAPSQPVRPPKPGEPALPARPLKVPESSSSSVLQRQLTVAGASSRPPLPGKNLAARAKSMQEPAAVSLLTASPSLDLGDSNYAVLPDIPSSTSQPVPSKTAPVALAVCPSNEIDEVECEPYYFGCMDTWAESLTECIFQTYLELVEIRAVTPNKVSFKLAGTSITMEDKGSKHFVRRHYPLRSLLLFELDPDQRTCKVKKEKKPLSVFGMVLRKPGQEKNMCHLFAAQHVTASGIIDAVQSALEIVTSNL